MLHVHQTFLLPQFNILLCAIPHPAEAVPPTRHRLGPEMDPVLDRLSGFVQRSIMLLEVLARSGLSLQDRPECV